MRQLWRRTRQSHLPQNAAWSSFHENSKTSAQAYAGPRGEEEVRVWMAALDRDMFMGYPAIELPPASGLDASLLEILARRRSRRNLERRHLALSDLASILYAAYGVTRKGAPALRTVPSAGAMYPLDVVVVASSDGGVAEGAYWYVPQRHCLRRVRGGGAMDEFAAMTVDRAPIEGASFVVLVIAAFERTIYKYGERGYRFALLEAGHVGQNIQLAAAALWLGSLPLGGYLDRQVDAWLGLDGVQMSCVYGVAVGGIPEQAAMSDDGSRSEGTESA